MMEVIFQVLKYIVLSPMTVTFSLVGHSMHIHISETVLRALPFIIYVTVKGDAGPALAHRHY